MRPYLVAACAVFGLVVGSFLNVVIARVPEGQSVVRPGSRCPSCCAVLLRRDNVPVLSWIVLRARCRSCRASIPVRYPLVEGLTAVIFAALGARLGLAAELPAYLVLGACLVVVSATDIERRTVPAPVVHPALAVTTVLLAVAAGIDGRWGDLVRAGFGAAGAFLLAAVLARTRPRAVDARTIRLAPLIGVHLGFLGIVHLGVGVLLAAGLSLGAVLVHGTPYRTWGGGLVPLAPLLSAAGLVTILAS